MDRKYNIGDEVCINLDKFGEKWDITVKRLSPNKLYKIFAHGNPVESYKYFSVDDEGCCFFFTDEYIDKSKTSQLKMNDNGNDWKVGDEFPSHDL